VKPQMRVLGKFPDHPDNSKKMLTAESNDSPSGFLSPKYLTAISSVINTVNGSCNARRGLPKINENENIFMIAESANKTPVSSNNSPFCWSG